MDLSLGLKWWNPFSELESHQVKGVEIQLLLLLWEESTDKNLNLLK